MKPWVSWNDGEEVTKEQSINGEQINKISLPIKWKSFRGCLYEHKALHSLGLSHSPALCPHCAFQDFCNLPIQHAVARKWRNSSHHNATYIECTFYTSQHLFISKAQHKYHLLRDLLLDWVPSPKQWKLGILLYIHIMPYSYTLGILSLSLIHLFNKYFLTIPLC